MGSADALGAPQGARKEYYQPLKPKIIKPAIVRIALRQRGIPYVWGGASRSGFDCSGLVMYVWGKVGVHLDHYTGALLSEGVPVSSLARARPGDLLFPHAGHVLMYLGRGEAIHAPHSGDVVRVVSATERPIWAIRRPIGARWATEWKVKRPPRNTYRFHAEF